MPEHLTNDHVILSPDPCLMCHRYRSVVYLLVGGVEDGSKAQYANRLRREYSLQVLIGVRIHYL